MKAPACVKTARVSAPCSKCGGRPDVVHIAGAPVAVFCERCGPDCRVGKVESADGGRS